MTISSISAFYGGWFDEGMMRITEIFQAFPFLLAAITLTAVLQTMYGRDEANILLLMTKGLGMITFFDNPFGTIDPVRMSLLTGMLWRSSSSAG